MKPPPQGWLAEALREATPLIGLGIQFAMLVLIGVGAGWWVDKRFAIAPWGILVGALIGIIVGFYHFIRTALRTTDRRERRPKDSA